VMTRLIDRNTTIPTSRSQVFSTAADNQTSVEVHVLQGERDMARDNRTLGRFHLDGIPPAPRGMPQIEVTFDLDANGILNVKAQDKGTGREQSVTITASSTLNKDEVDRMVKEAEAHSSEDRAKREEVELRNQADHMIHQAEKIIKDNESRIPEDVKSEVNTKLEALKTAAKGSDRGPSPYFLPAVLAFFRRRTRLWAVAGVWTGSLLTAFNVYAAAVTYVPQFLVRNDFRLVYGAALNAWQHGYGHLYDFAGQKAAVEGLGAYWSPFINPPPFGWLGTMFLPLPFDVAVVLWTALVFAAALLAWYLVAPGAGLTRAAHL